MSNRKQSMVPSEVRKQSVVPNEGRRKSIYERKPSVDGKKSTLDVPNVGRRASIDFRRMSISEGRKFSMADSLAGRSGLLNSAGKDRMIICYENTYKLEPDQMFPIYEAKRIAEEILESNLREKEYNRDECIRMSTTMSDKIKQQIKTIAPENSRFRIVIIVAIGQAQETNPSLSFTSRCIWNDKLDNYAQATFKSKHLYAVALVYVLYKD